MAIASLTVGVALLAASTVNALSAAPQQFVFFASECRYDTPRDQKELIKVHPLLVRTNGAEMCFLKGSPVSLHVTDVFYRTDRLGLGGVKVTFTADGAKKFDALESEGIGKPMVLMTRQNGQWVGVAHVEFREVMHLGYLTIVGMSGPEAKNLHDVLKPPAAVAKQTTN